MFLKMEFVLKHHSFVLLAGVGCFLFSSGGIRRFGGIFSLRLKQGLPNAQENKCVTD